jgi:RimJ/RimL family protein N-acetyltransferase
MYLETERLVLREPVQSDLEQMQRWRPYRNPLSATWNTRWRSTLDMEGWLERYRRDLTREMYTVALRDGQVIGRLSLRHIRPRQHSVLGIALGADWANHGYGTEVLVGYMPHYFSERGFRRMLLDVAAPNLRAVRCYEKVGFSKTGEHFQYVTSSEARAFRAMPEYERLSHMLRLWHGQNQMLFYDMELTHTRWAERGADVERV